MLRLRTNQCKVIGCGLPSGDDSIIRGNAHHVLLLSYYSQLGDCSTVKSALTSFTAECAGRSAHRLTPAATNPSAINASNNVTVPSLQRLSVLRRRSARHAIKLSFFPHKVLCSA